MIARPEWMDQAACKGSTEKFLLPEGRSPRFHTAFWAEARTICARCPVRIDCLRFAMTCVPKTDECMYAGLAPSTRRREIRNMRARAAQW